MIQNVVEAYERIKKVVNLTPVHTSSTLDQMIRCNCYLKCENFQKTGSFKFRGAYNALSQLSSEKKKRGVITHSSGNHAQALALASKLLGIKAVVVMPENASPSKVAATKDYGAEVVTCGSAPTDREEAVHPLMQKYGYTLIHPSNDLNIIAGAGTAALELLRTTGELDYVFCPVGGGGLLSGTSIAVKGLTNSTKTIGVEPKNADDTYRSLRAGRIIPSGNPNTIADGLRTSLGDNTFRIIKENVNEVITVSEIEIINAMQLLWERMKLVIEPSGAVSLAGTLSKQIPFESTEKIGIIVSGGNIDLGEFFKRIRWRILQP